MTSDPTINEIRRIRHEVSAECSHDPRNMLAFYSQIQSRVKARLVNYGEIEAHTGSQPPDTK